MTEPELEAIEARANAETPEELAEWASLLSTFLSKYGFVPTANSGLCAALRLAWAEIARLKENMLREDGWVC